MNDIACSNKEQEENKEVYKAIKFINFYKTY